MAHAPTRRPMADSSLATATSAVRLRFFAHYRDLTGTRECEAELPAGATVADLLKQLRSDPCFAALPAAPLVAVNREYADHDRRLETGDEIALIPPVSGG